MNPADGREADDSTAQAKADPAWVRFALAGLLVVTAVGYLWDIGRNGWGNTFYAAAVQAGTHSWRSFFFGSFDWADYITVDKPPVSLWIMALSGRVFGFHAWSMLAPQALLGVGSVALLYAAVRRAWGAPAGLAAGALLALTPAAALMFRFNNPDAALTFFMVAAAYALTRALERGRSGWLMAAAALLGTAFLAKSLQAMLVVPGLTLAYLCCAPVRLGRRLAQLVAAGAVLAVSGLWWPLLVDAIPAGSRPYVGGSSTNSVMQLILGFNGIGRITGQQGGPGGGRPGGGGPGGGGPGGFGGEPGLGRMFNADFAGFIAWWLPAALIGLAAGVWLVLRIRRTTAVTSSDPAAPQTPLLAGRRTSLRTDPRTASLIVWGGWTLVTAAVFSFASGIIHSYYTVALAPGVAALVGMVLPALWRLRGSVAARGFLAAMAASTAVTTFLVLGYGGWQPWLAWAVLVVGSVSALALLVVRPSGAGRRAVVVRRLGVVAGVGAVVAGIAVPSVWSVATIGSTHTGSIPGVGPAAAAGLGGLPAGPAGFRRRGDGDRPGPDFPGPDFRQGGNGQSGNGQGGNGQGGNGQGGNGQGGLPPGGFTPGGFPPDGFPQGGSPQGGSPAGGTVGGGPGTWRVGPGRPGDADRANPELAALVKAGAAGFRWAAAAPGSQSAGPLQLAADVPVMSLGGFNGGDDAITLDRFKALVAAHQVHYFVPGGGLGAGPGGRGASMEIASWVGETFVARTVGSTTVYDLTAPKPSSTP